MAGGGGPGPPGATPDHFWGNLRDLLERNRPAGRRTKLLGLLATRPSLDVFKKDVEPQWDWFHLRSGDALHVVVLGYGDMNSRSASRQFQNDWLQAGIEAIQQRTNWTYSGESDLLLCNVTYEAQGGVRIRISEAVCITVETAVKDGLITSLSNLVEKIRFYAASHHGDDLLWGFSDSLAKGSVREALRLLLYSVLPDALKGKAKALEHAAVRNIARPTRPA